MGDENKGSGNDLQLDTSDEIDEEVFEDNWGSLQVGYDLEEGEKPLPDPDVVALSAATAALSVRERAAGEPEAVVDFLRSFLSERGMADTLDCFQAEWEERIKKGLIDAKRVDVMPEVYILNRCLDTELGNAKRERDEYTQAIAAAEQAVVKLQKAKDFHWLRHKCAIQDKKKLVQDIRKLTNECNDVQPKIKRMDEKYQKLVQQTVNASVERDIANNAKLDSASRVDKDRKI